MSLHTFLGVIGYGLIGLFALALVGVAVYLSGHKERKRRCLEAEKRYKEHRQRVERHLQSGKKII